MYLIAFILVAAAVLATAVVLGQKSSPPPTGVTVTPSMSPSPTSSPSPSPAVSPVQNLFFRDTFTESGSGITRDHNSARGFGSAHRGRALPECRAIPARFFPVTPCRMNELCVLISSLRSISSFSNHFVRFSVPGFVALFRVRHARAGRQHLQARARRRGALLAATTPPDTRIHGERSARRLEAPRAAPRRPRAVGLHLAASAGALSTVEMSFSGDVSQRPSDWRKRANSRSSSSPAVSMTFSRTAFSIAAICRSRVASSRITDSWDDLVFPSTA